MTKQELEKMFEGYEEYVEISDNYVNVLDFEGFDENWNEIMIDVPDVVCERANVCCLMGVEVHYASEDI